MHVIVDEQHVIIGAFGPCSKRRAFKREPNRPRSDGDCFFQQLAKECNPRRTSSAQHATLCPPEHVVGIEIRFAMSAVNATRRCEPEASDEFVARDASPVRWDVALVLAF